MVFGCKPQETNKIINYLKERITEGLHYPCNFKLT